MDRIIHTELFPHENREIKILVLGDTHLTSTEKLDVSLMQEISAVAPDVIFHTGDIINAHTVECLREVSITFAVRGNRDWRNWNELPAIRTFSLFGKDLALFHGHGTFCQYWYLKALTFTFRRAVFTRDFTFPPESRDAHVILYGHTHYPRLEKKGAQIILNPGAAHVNHSIFGMPFPSFAIITCKPNENWQYEIRTAILHMRKGMGKKS